MMFRGIRPALAAATVLFLTLASAPAPAQSPPAPAASGRPPPSYFDFSKVYERAAALAARPYAKPADKLPPFLAKLDYDRYRQIRFRPDRALWRNENLPFQVQFFSRGFLFNERVAVNVVYRGVVSPVRFDRGLFDFGSLTLPEKFPENAGFAGFRIHYPVNRADYHDEVVVFQGASYFRAVAKGEAWGLSARGLAIDTGLPKTEEFPVFREFWIKKPEPGATRLTVFALMDSPSVTGAFRFVVTPGTATVLEVTEHLFFRKSVEKVGIAPLTSMFFHGENTERFVDDFRPEVHDSDGLLIVTGSGEHVWRPLANPDRLTLSAFGGENVKGFGLLQRDRAFGHYQDLEAHYERRPSAWVEPLGAWGKGTIQLIEIPSPSERNDNIVAFWVPDDPIKPKARLTFEYRLSFSDDPQGGAQGARVIATRIGGGGTDELTSARRKFVIDFEGPVLERVTDVSSVEAVVTASAGTLSPAIVQRNPHTGGLRVHFELTPPAADAPVELRAFLRRDQHYLSETWTYQWRRRRAR